MGSWAQLTQARQIQIIGFATVQVSDGSTAWYHAFLDTLFSIEGFNLSSFKVKHASVSSVAPFFSNAIASKPSWLYHLNFVCETIFILFSGHQRQLFPWLADLGEHLRLSR